MPPPLSGFPPICSVSATILILGTMPGNASLQAGEYYAYKHNAFWRIMHALYDIAPDAPYTVRCRQLRAQRIAVWDVLKQCRRKTSSDSDIEATSLVVNDFAAFYARHHRIRRIFFNGSKAAELERRHVLPQLPPTAAALTRITLPSTSPANATLSLAEKTARWREALAAHTS